MRFEESCVEGVFVISSEVHSDPRGSFQRSYCRQEFTDHGLEPVEVQAALSRNRTAATLRGLHFTPEDYGEAKLVRCVHGRIFDVAVDLRESSPTYRQHVGIQLDAEAGNALYLPPGVAHGFITLVDDSIVHYQFSRPHAPQLDRGVRWNDPDLAVDWPIEPTVLSDRDRSLPFLKDLRHG